MGHPGSLHSRNWEQAATHQVSAGYEERTMEGRSRGATSLTHGGAGVTRKEAGLEEGSALKVHIEADFDSLVVAHDGLSVRTNQRPLDNVAAPGGLPFIGGQ